jgi:hypothetical protein
MLLKEWLFEGYNVVKKGYFNGAQKEASHG